MWLLELRFYPFPTDLCADFCRYTVSGPSTARPLPDWLTRRRKRSEKYDPENLNNFELLQEFEFEEGWCTSPPILLFLFPFFFGDKLTQVTSEQLRPS